MGRPSSPTSLGLLAAALFLLALSGSLRLVMALEVEDESGLSGATAQSLEEAAEFAAYFPQLSVAHFRDRLNELLAKGSNKTAIQELLANTTQSRIRSLQQNADINAAAIQVPLLALKNEDAYNKLTSLKLFLIGRDFANLSRVNELRDFGLAHLIQHYLDSVAKVDPDTQETRITPYNRIYRALLLGLNALIVHVHNNMSTTSKLALNHLSLLDPFELKYFQGYILDPSRVRNFTDSPASNDSSQQDGSNSLIAVSTSAVMGHGESLPESVDWVAAGYLGPVLNQGSCGSCWAFTAATVISSRLAVSGKANVTDLSEQQLVSCSTSNLGCAGGSYENAWSYVQVSGLVSSAQYPYTCQSTTQTPPCDTSTLNQPVVSATPFKLGQAPGLKTEADLKAALATGGPIALAISTPSCFKQYSSGVLMQSDCPCYAGPSSINHAVTLVGYGVSNGINYWLIRNSWGAGWGMNGNVMLQMGVSGAGMCGMLTDPNYPSSVELSPECQAATPPSYCQAPYPATDESSSLPAWAWVLIGLAIAIGLLLCVGITGFCCQRYAPSDAWYNIFAKPEPEGYKLLSKDEVNAGVGPVPNNDPRAFGGQPPATTTTTALGQV